jgi:nitroreductase
MIRELIIKNRSYRRFDPTVNLDERTLRKLVDLARLSGSAANRQPLKYLLSWQPERNALIFKHLAWAGYLVDWPGPAQGERPTGYIIVLGDRRISEKIDCDHGIACQSILLGAVERGFGGCIVGSINRSGLRKELSLPREYEILLVIALGKPSEEVVLEEKDEEHDIRYWRDENDVHHVPKRTLDDVIIRI